MERGYAEQPAGPTHRATSSYSPIEERIKNMLGNRLKTHQPKLINPNRIAGMERIGPHVVSNAQSETSNLKSWLGNTLITDS